MAPGYRKNSSIADEQTSAVKCVNEDIKEMVVNRYYGTLAGIGVNQPQCERRPHERSSYQDSRNGALQCVVCERGLISERMNNGDIAIYGYQNDMQCTHVASHLDEQRETRDDHVRAARIVEDVERQNIRIIPQHGDAGQKVRHQHTGQDEVCLGPESGRFPNGYKCKAVVAKAENGQSEGKINHHQELNCWRRLISQTFSVGRSHRDVVAGAGVDIGRL